MRRFGLNPYGEAKYRIVWAPSRKRIVYGQWPDGSTGARFVAAYPVGDIWIMEQWRSAAEFAKMSEAQWNLEMTILGPYPTRGEYEICHSFETSTPDDANLEKLILWIEKSNHVRFYDTQDWHRRDAEREKEVIGNQQEAMIRNWLPAFGTAPMSGYRGGRSHKAAPITRTAEELGLPTQGGQLRSKHNPNRQKFAVPLTEAVL